MTLRLKNGRFATAAKARAQRNKYFHRALISAAAAMRRGFGGTISDFTINERRITLDEPITDWADIIRLARNVEVTKNYPDLIYNVSLQDSTGRWFAATHAWESVELAMRELERRIKELMEKYQRAAGNNEEDEYAIVAVEVSVYPWRR